MNDREEKFTTYYCLSIYTMRIAKFCLEISKDYSLRPGLKHSLHVASKSMDSKIADIMLKLKDDSRHDLLHDLASDDLQALGNILHHIISASSISDIEDPLVDFIRQIKKIQNEKLEKSA